MAFAQDAPAIPGRIAVVGADYNLYLLDPQSGQQTALTDDARVSDQRDPHLRKPGLVGWRRACLLWHVGGFQRRQDGNPDFGGWQRARHQRRDVARFVDHLRELVAAQLAARPAATSPCCSAPRIAFKVDIVRAQGSDYSLSETGSGAPFYFSWSPDGSQMLWQRDSTRLEIFDIAQQRIAKTLPQFPGAMFAPAWSPVDDRLLFATQNGDTSDLVISSDGDLQTLAADQANPLLFAWSPDGTQIGYIDRRGPLVVVDAASGEVVAQSHDANVQAFFWSPDSQHVAYVTSGITPSGSFNASAARRALGDQDRRADASDLNCPHVVGDRPCRRSRQALWLIRADARGDLHAELLRPVRAEPSIWSPDSRYLVYGERSRNSLGDQFAGYDAGSRRALGADRWRRRRMELSLTIGASFSPSHSAGASEQGEGK